MIEYVVDYWDKLGWALIEHLEIVIITLLISIFIASILTIIAIYSRILSEILIHVFSVVYSIPSLALFAMLIPVSGLGKGTAIIVLIAYNQYLLLRNFIAGLNEVEPSIIEAATGMGMTNMQILFKIRLPLSKKALFTGVRLSVVSTIGIATIAAFINAGGIGSVLSDGLRTMNVYEIVWGSILAASLAIGVNAILSKMEKII
ncbi:osmoprotectant transport system permease protein [Clostridium acetobutylicum]|uniref:Proline/glycine betaine ABC-type transport system, permease component n=1 Tax=Clostridium acetobutylicum (strain ATCC 824 / DSM 792 / JCM 1419 / IAM 19013 / LMG 5710 / NBRC 13948 / NRRL B-527 / VKM B-1787 / 2291 / W) TaxID=272562 RepID=Q97J10_CLOAB|nr:MULTISPECIES: ABC transporter permease [Clostridium]AAK79444.1 Proline/glycine betaine ABC-type transport system, permease component [Clostridium acetobutylicum ATCC 824]ADZ20529.1 Proline/glycine betaine ABC-type transport system, permease component [Clostridium acetobutylicum EA 2018]AEI31828.1 proline/glycine betaine ABC-type transport system, permease component [Clostridium acetobutylicum DSM 1731]AWV81310.1 ABC transporter permease [Clostridium acetobutylicum]MBC2392943.1 ABC transport